MNEAKEKMLEAIEQIILDPDLIDEWIESYGTFPDIINDKILHALDEYLLAVLPKTVGALPTPYVRMVTDQIKKNAGI